MRDIKFRGWTNKTATTLTIASFPIDIEFFIKDKIEEYGLLKLAKETNVDYRQIKHLSNGRWDKVTHVNIKKIARFFQLKPIPCYFERIVKST